MKKTKILFLIILFCASLIFAKSAREPKDRNFIGFNFGLGAAIPLYTDNAQWNVHEKLNQEKYARIIFANDAGISLKLGKMLFFVFDFDFTYDLAWQGNYHCNAIDYAFSSGFQFYPNTKKFSCKIEYCLGYRIDSINLPDELSVPKKARWGNGFKIAAEYDFIEGGGIIPVIGAYYRFMPRGYNEYDNIFSIYFRLGIR